MATADYRKTYVAAVRGIRPLTKVSIKPGAGIFRSWPPPAICFDTGDQRFPTRPPS